MVRYKVYLKGFGSLKERNIHSRRYGKIKIYPSKLKAQSRLNLEKRRGGWKGRIIRIK